jgi:hypothetical protein
MFSTQQKNIDLNHLIYLKMPNLTFALCKSPGTEKLELLSRCKAQTQGSSSLPQQLPS